MRKVILSVLAIIGTVSAAGIACAADAGTVANAPAAAKSLLDAYSVSMTYLAAAIGMAIAAAGCGIAQGLGLKAACEGTARNPEAGGKVTVTLILGLAFIESLAIYALVINLILLFMNPLGTI